LRATISKLSIKLFEFMSINPKIWQSAQQMIDRFGDDALTEIKKRVDELEELGEKDACAVWIQIRQATQTLIESQRRERKQ